MGSPSFASVQTALTGAEDVDTFQCIAEVKGLRCSRQVTDHLDEAIALLETGAAQRDLNEADSFMDHLVCEEHKRNKSNNKWTYYHRNAIRKKWQAEFDPGFFDSHRDPRRSSMTSSRNSTPVRTHSATPVTPRGCVDRPIPSSTGSDSNVLTRALHASNGSPVRHVRSTSEGALRLLEPRRGTPSIMLDGADSITADGQQVRDLDSSGIVPAPERPRPSTPTATVIAETPHPAPEIDAPPAEPATASKRKRNDSKSEGIEPGEKSFWSPETVHDEVRAVLLADLPSAKQTGTLYIFHDPDTKHVKIGYTMDTLDTRFPNIVTQSKRDMLDRNTGRYLSGVPYVQLLRLEKLVHTDLAHYQRNLHVPTTRGCKTQHEWFKVDVSHAKKMVDFWWGFMCLNRIEPGVKLDPALRDALQSSADEMAKEVTGSLTEREAWDIIRGSDENRLLLWKRLIPPGKRQRRDLRWLAGWVVAAVLLGIIYFPRTTAGVLGLCSFGCLDDARVD